MSEKCCKRKPPCKDCPKLKKRKKKGLAGLELPNAIPQGDFLRGAVCPQKRPNSIIYLAPFAMSINGQRGCTAKAPAGLAGVPACRRRQPASAIIAPLSVQNSSSG